MRSLISRWRRFKSATLRSADWCVRLDFAAGSRSCRDALPVLIMEYQIECRTSVVLGCWDDGKPARRISVRQYVYAAALFLVASAPGSADVRIRSSPGGEVLSYLTLFELVRKSGERVIIDGPCLSACTLVLSVVPGNRICVTRKAVLGFHAAIAVDRHGRHYSASEATRVIAETYPAPVRAWIGRHGGLSQRVLLLRGRELTAMYRSCS